MAFPSGWPRKAVIAIDAARVAGSSDHGNFPAFLTEANLPAEMLDADGPWPALNSGGDIRFSSDALGLDPIAGDIVSFITDTNPANGRAAIWVRVPTLSPATGAAFYIWWGKAGEVQPVVTDPFGRNAVWADHQLALIGNDIDRSGNDTLSTVGTPVQGAGGPLGVYTTFNSAARWKSVNTALLGLPATHNMTVTMLTRKSGYGGANAAASWQNASQLGIHIYPMDTAAPNGNRVWWLNGGSSGNLIPHGISRANDWVWTSLTISSTTLARALIDGGGSLTANRTNNTSSAVGPFQDFFVAGRGTSEGFNGDIAAIFVSKTARSDDWLATLFNNQSSPATFAIAGTPEDAGSSAAVATFDSFGHAFSLAPGLIEDLFDSADGISVHGAATVVSRDLFPTAFSFLGHIAANAALDDSALVLPIWQGHRIDGAAVPGDATQSRRIVRPRRQTTARIASAPRRHGVTGT